MPLGYVVSDLHMFSYNSLYERYLTQIFDGCSRASVIVLNGDIFDFKRSRFRTHEETTTRAITWLADFADRFKESSIEYLIGNHDCIDLFTSALRTLAESTPNLRVSDDFVRLEDKIFLHGDIVDCVGSDFDLAALRSRYRQGARSRSSILAAEIITRLRFNLFEYLRHSREELAEKIYSYLQLRDPGFETRTTDVYFGHTHVPFTEFQHRGIRFTNTGSAVRGLRFAPTTFTLLSASRTSK